MRRRTDGVLEYLGRTDFQVKLRGQRVELGEIESAIASAPGVVHAAATVIDSPTGDQHLIGYVSPASVDIEVVRAAVAASLPVYMVPTVWVGIDDVVLNSAGKLDRKALPEPDFGSVETEYVAPANPVEESLATVFADVLGAERVSVTGSFFDLGGNSLSAMRLAARASEVLGVEVSVRDIFGAPSVRELISGIGSRRRPGPGHRCRSASCAHPVVVRPTADVVHQPLRRVGRHLQHPRRPALDRRRERSERAECHRRTGCGCVAAGRDRCPERHEVLRTSFPAENGIPFQQVGDIAEFDDRRIWQIADSVDGVIAAATTGFDVTTQWPIRVRLAQADSAGQEYLLAVVAHHIGLDGESMLPLVTDIVTAYSARTQGDSPSWTPLPVQFADYAIWQHEVLGSADDTQSVIGRQLGYWREQLAGLPDVLELPADRQRPGGVLPGRRPFLRLPARGFRRDHRHRKAIRYHRVHGGPRCAVGAVGAAERIGRHRRGHATAGRGQAVLDPLVGMFVNTLVLRAGCRAASPSRRCSTMSGPPTSGVHPRRRAVRSGCRGT